MSPAHLPTGNGSHPYAQPRPTLLYSGRNALNQTVEDPYVFERG